MDLNVVYSKIQQNKQLRIFREKYTKAYAWKKIGWNVFRTILFGGMIYVMIYPILFIITTSIKTYPDLLDPTTIWIAKNPTIANYVTAFTKTNYMLAFKNSAIISSSTSVLQVISCSIIGYGFARFKFKEKNLIFALVLFTMIIPPQTMIVSQFIYYSKFDVFGIFSFLSRWFPAIKPPTLLDSFAPFVLPTIFGLGLKSGFFIYIFRQFFRGMPMELEDAAYIDGCGPAATYMRIMLPNAIPAILTVFLFSFVWHWNDVFEPSIFIQDQFKKTLPLKLVSIESLITKDEIINDPLLIIGPQQAGVFLVILPMLALFIFGQKFFVEGVERTGIVG